MSLAKHPIIPLLMLLISSWRSDPLLAQDPSPEPPSAPRSSPTFAPAATPLSSPTLSPSALRQEIRRLRLEMLDVLNDLENLERLLELPPSPSPSPLPVAPLPSPTASPILPGAPEPPDSTPAATPSPDPDQPDTPGPVPAPGPTIPNQQSDTSPLSAPEEPSPSPALSEITALQVGTQTISLPGDVLFDFDEADIRPEAALLLQQVAETILDMSRARIIVEGHTDNVGDESYNQALSLARANAVKRYLAESIPDQQNYSWLTKGMGSSQPIASNTSAEGRQQNRRVDLIIAP